MFKKTTLLGAALAILVASPAFSSPDDHLVGWWKFDDLTEETGNWGDVALHGGALLENGELVVDASKWAHSLDYTGDTIEELSLVTWVTLDSLAKTNGSALTLDKATVDQFCAIVWAERVDRQWMAGSSHFRRTADFPNAVTEPDDSLGTQVYLVITYEDNNGKYDITGYRNGESLGTYTTDQAQLRQWPAGDAEAIWGKRHTSSGLVGPGHLIAHIDESRIYDTALTQNEVNSLRPGGLSVEPTGKLASQWGRLKSR